MPNQGAYQQCIQAFTDRDYESCIRCAMSVPVTEATPDLRQLRLISLQRLGRTAEADKFGSRVLTAGTSDSWEQLLLKLTLAQTDIATALRMARDGRQRCQAHYYAGAHHLTEGEIDKARREFLACLSTNEQCLEGQLAQWEYENPELSVTNLLWPIKKLNQQCAQLYEQGQYEKANHIAEEAYDLARKQLGVEHCLTVDSLTYLAQVLSHLCEYGKSRTHYEEALVTQKQLFGLDHPDVAYSLLRLGQLSIILGEYVKGRKYLEESLAVHRNAFGQEHEDTAHCLHELASLLLREGEYPQSIVYYEQALDILEKAEDPEHIGMASIQSNLGFLFRMIGDYSKAQSYYEQSLEIFRNEASTEHNEAIATILNNLGRLYHVKGDTVRAVAYYKESADILEKVVGLEHDETAKVIHNIAVLLHDLGRHDDAKQYYERALMIKRKVLGYSHPSTALTVNCLGTLFRSTEDYSQALSYLEQALAIRKQVLPQTHPDTATSLYNVAGLYVILNRKLEAFQLMSQAISADNWIIGQVFSVGSESQRTVFLNQTYKFLTIFLSFVMDYLKELPGAIQAAMETVVQRKGIGTEALATQRDAVLSGKYPAVAHKLREITTLRTQIVRKTLDGPGTEGLQTHEQLLAELNSQKEQLEAEVARQIPEINLEQKLHSIDRQVVAMALPKGATLVEFVRFDVFDFKAVPARGESQRKLARYLAFVMPAEEPDSVAMIDLGEAEPIDQMIATFREIIMAEAEESERGLGAAPRYARRATGEDVGARLREAIFTPLLKAIGGGKRLMISPDGDLARLPFEVLPTEDGRRLIDDYRISYLSAGRDVVRFQFKSDRKPSRSLVAADPDFDLGAKAMPAEATHLGRRSRDFKRGVTKTFERLPATSREGKNIAAMLDAELWTEGEVLDARLKQCRSPRILHLATHGFFLEDQKRDPNDERFGSSAMSFSESGLQRLADARFENPLLRSGLALAGVNTWLEKGELMEEAEDGLLTAEDVSGLDLLDTELVVLSACDTGLGEVHVGEGVFGLQRAFVLAGAKTLVMSLWDVPDEQTRELMEDFYRRILAGEPRADALREAQLAIKAKHPEPFYWGAFICQGNPSPLLAPFGNGRSTVSMC
jgi:CHAT domain-containing protein/tetratricopeptide (TPR) repeat protein